MIKLKSFLYILSSLCVFSNKHSSDWSIVPTTANHITASPRHRISQPFALPPATKPVSHLPCPLPPNQSVICLAPYHRVTVPLHHHVTTLVSHLPCPLPPSQSVICLAPCHQTSQSFALPPATKPVSHLPCPLPSHHCVTTLVSHLPCPLPPSQSVICLAPCHQTSQSFALPPTTVSPRHLISQSFALPPATKPVSHLPCPLPPNQSVIGLAPCHCHHTSQSFALPPTTASLH